MARASRSMRCFNSGEEASCEARTLMALRPYHPHRTGIGFQGDQVSRPASMPSVRVIIRAPPLEGNSDSRRSVGDGTTSQVSCPHMSAAWYQATLLPGPALLLDTFNFSAMLEAFVFFIACTAMIPTNQCRPPVSIAASVRLAIRAQLCSLSGTRSITTRNEPRSATPETCRYSPLRPRRQYSG